MINLKELEGESVFLKPTGNYARYNEYIKTAKILKVAKAFITLDIEGLTKKLRIGRATDNYVILTIDNLNSGYDLYKDSESLNKEIESGNIRRILYCLFSGYNNSESVSHEKLVAIAKILEINYES